MSSGSNRCAILLKGMNCNKYNIDKCNEFVLIVNKKK